MRLGKTLALLASLVAFGCGSAGSDTREPSGSPPPEGEEVAGEQCGHGSAMGGHGMRHASAMGGHGMRHGRGGAHGPSQDQRDDFHALLDGHQAITREVERTADGVSTTTTSDDPATVETLRRHVRSMYEHMSSGGRVHPWDPIFAALGERSDEIELTIEDIDGGVRVTGRGTTPEAIALVQAHADVVSAFVANGHEEAHREHPVPAIAE